jgi:tripartite-type tricarboxylate transporter receptor subunit TctC
MGRWGARALARVVTAAGVAFAATAGAQTAPTLAGKTVRMIIPFGPGGGYDLWARLVARHIGKYLPGAPTVVPENMPGAGGFTGGTYIYNVAPKDGTVIGILASNAPFASIFKETGAQFEANKFTWLGTPTTDINVCIAKKSANVRSFGDLQRQQLIVGDTGPGTDTQLYPRALRGILGAQFKLVTGFPSTVDVFVAMERGEVDGVCESYQSVLQKRPTWIANGDVNVILQGGVAPDPRVKAPFVVDLAKTAEQQEEIKFVYSEQGIGRPFLAPPGMDPARVKMLRDAFAATMKDPDFVADAQKAKVTVASRDGAYLLGIIDAMYATPRAVIEKVQAVAKD